ncbi:MAG: agmatinase family protein [Deltaproteobacteria bacterium]|nr:agmatinase family protein [Deltaproteobacteria bacterium]
MNQIIPFDPDGPPAADAGFFGLSPRREDSRVVITAAPFEATVSYRTGTADAPESMRIASHQIDLFDLDVGTPTEQGIFYDDTPSRLADSSKETRAFAERVVDAITSNCAPDPLHLASVNEASRNMVGQIHGQTQVVLHEDKLPFLVGGDHSVSEGSIRAVAESVSRLTILQFDAHADLRKDYEGFTHSHASVMHNILELHDDVRLVQVGIRDLCLKEKKRIDSDPRIVLFDDRMLRKARQAGLQNALFSDIAKACTESVYISFDIDGLEPSLCPNTGTPVPGGLFFDEAVSILEEVSRSCTVVGGDLVEVGVAPTGEWDSVVGARLLHKMIGFALLSQRS